MGMLWIASIFLVFTTPINSEIVFNWTIEHEFELPIPNQKLLQQCTPTSTFALLTAIEIQQARYNR